MPDYIVTVSRRISIHHEEELTPDEVATIACEVIGPIYDFVTLGGKGHSAYPATIRKLAAPIVHHEEKT